MSKYLNIYCLFLLLSVILTACQGEFETPLVTVNSPLITVEPTVIQSAQPVSTDSPVIAVLPTNTPEDTKPDPAAIQAAWESSPHASTYILDANGQNNTCARCHAPINWLPSMDDLPESCYACKFELEPPPPTIAESEWVDIPCKVCHTVDKKGNIQPEVAWLEIAPLGEYAKVTSNSELCMKCHAPVDIPGHGKVQVAGAHAGYDCTKCHSAHDTTATCNPPGCHIESATPVLGHDGDHQSVSCVACHDGSGMEVGPHEETGFWVTFSSDSADNGGGKFAFTSHNIVLEAPCERCHFTGNPWDLSESIVKP